MLEVQIAFALLGIGLAGLCPMVVMQLRQLTKIESRLKSYSHVYNGIGMSQRTEALGQEYYLVPRLGLWPRKLTARARVIAAEEFDPMDYASNVETPPTSTTSKVMLTKPVSFTRDANGEVTAAKVELRLESNKP